jgi:putative membrane protein
LLLDAAEEPSGERVDTGWAPETLHRHEGGNTARNLIAAGLLVLLLGWLALSTARFVRAQFAASQFDGIVTLAVFGTGLLLLAGGAWHELRAYRRLRRVDALRTLLHGKDSPLEPAKALCRPWLDALVRQGSLMGTVLPAMEAASSMPHLRAVLRQQAEAPLRQGARQIGRTMALQGGLLTALCPSPALDGVLALLKGLQLVRAVARLYGLRPGPAMTLVLLRRLAWTAAGASGVDLLSQSVAEGLLHNTPVLRQVAASLPGSGAVAIRLYRLADVTATACSPLTPPQR